MCRSCATDPALALTCRAERAEALRDVYLFRGLPEEILHRLLERSRERQCEPDEWLCHGGEPADTFFLVLRGEVALARLTDEGDELIVAIVGPGELFGEDLACLDQACHPLSARAVGPAVVVAFDRRVLSNLLDERPQLLRKLLETLFRRNAILLEEMERLALQSATDRLLSFLERRAAAAGPGPPPPFPKRVLASRLGMRPETLSRVLGRLKAGDRLREVDGCLLLQGGGEACGECPVRLWGCPGPGDQEPTLRAAAVARRNPRTPRKEQRSGKGPREPVRLEQHPVGEPQVAPR